MILCTTLTKNAPIRPIRMVEKTKVAKAFVAFYKNCCVPIAGSGSTIALAL
jgi:hypothetical protein